MSDTLVALDLPPGIFRNGTTYQAKGRWFDSSLVRFLDRTIRPIGGWRRALDSSSVAYTALVGAARAALTWVDNNGNPLVAFATHTKLFVISLGAKFDLTPVGFPVTGRINSITQTGSGNYGASLYGAGFYGKGVTAPQLLDADTWQLDNFGSMLAAVSTVDHKLYIWGGNTGVLPVVPTASSGTVPTYVDGVVVTPERFIAVFGWSAGVQSPRGITWAAQQSPGTAWDPITTSAGNWDLATAGRIMTARRTKGETLFWTNVDLHVMRYIGLPYIYNFTQVGDACGIISRKAAAVIGSVAFWMGNKGFYRYDGMVREIPSDVNDYVFSDMNVLQSAKIWSNVNGRYNEVTWYYPSGSSDEIDRYATYNWNEDHWTIGKLVRTTGVDAGTLANPLLVDLSGLIWEHEVGFDHNGLVPFVEGGPVEIGEGDRLVEVMRILPDEKTVGDVNVTFYGAHGPTNPETSYSYASITSETFVRFIARQVRIRLQEVRAGDWRVGTYRFGVKPSSRR